MNASIKKLALQLSHLLLEQKLKLVTAESCTGGGMTYYLVQIPGCSKWLDRGFITYSNQAKREELGILEETLSTQGAVSEKVVREMAEGALAHSQAEISIAVTGIAGPEGGSQDKPIGTVWLAFAGINKKTVTLLCHLEGDRNQIQEEAIRVALEKGGDFLLDSTLN